MNDWYKRPTLVNILNRAGAMLMIMQRQACSAWNDIHSSVTMGFAVGILSGARFVCARRLSARGERVLAFQPTSATVPFQP